MSIATVAPWALAGINSVMDQHRTSALDIRRTDEDQPEAAKALHDQHAHSDPNLTAIDQ